MTSIHEPSLFPRINLQPSTQDEILAANCACMFTPKKLLSAFIKISTHLGNLNSLYKDNVETSSNLLDIDVECDCVAELVEWIVAKLSSSFKAKDTTTNINNDEPNNIELMQYISSLEKHLTNLESNFLYLENGTYCNKCLNGNETTNKNQKMADNFGSSVKTPGLITDKHLGSSSLSSGCGSISFDKIRERGKPCFTQDEFESNKNYETLNSESNSSLSSLNTTLEPNQKSFFLGINSKKSFAIDVTSQFESLNITNTSNIEQILFKDIQYNRKSADDEDMNTLRLKLKQKDITIHEYKHHLKSARNMIEKMKKTREEWYENMLQEMKHGFKEKVDEYQKKESHIIKSQANEIEYMKAKLEMYRIKIKQLSEAVNHFMPLNEMQLPESVEQSYYDRRRTSIFNTNTSRLYATPQTASTNIVQQAPNNRITHKHRYSCNTIGISQPKGDPPSSNNILKLKTKTTSSTDISKPKRSVPSLHTKLAQQKRTTAGNGFGYLTKRQPTKYSTNT